MIRKFQFGTCGNVHSNAAQRVGWSQPTASIDNFTQTQGGAFDYAGTVRIADPARSMTCTAGTDVDLRVAACARDDGDGWLSSAASAMLEMRRSPSPAPAPESENAPCAPSLTPSLPPLPADALPSTCPPPPPFDEAIGETGDDDGDTDINDVQLYRPAPKNETKRPKTWTYERAVGKGGEVAR